MSPEQMLEHVYAIRSDIIDALEDHELHARQAKALMNAKNSLDEIFSKRENLESKYMECVRDAIEYQANTLSRDEFMKEVQNRNVWEKDES